MDSRPPELSSASRTAMEPTETPPEPIPEALRMRAPAWTAFSKRVLSVWPEEPARRAADMDPLTWPSTCSSPTTMESRPEATRSRCLHAPSPSEHSRLPSKSPSRRPVSEAHALFMRGRSEPVEYSSTLLQVCSITHSPISGCLRNSL